MNKSSAIVLLVIAVSIAAAVIAHLFGAGSSEIASWVQAVGSVVAVLAAVFIANDQARGQIDKDERDRKAIGHAAHQLAFQALELVGDRLDAAMFPGEKTERFLLRGMRTTEMVLAMREFDTQRLPPQLLSDFILLRSQIYAINARISDVHAEEDSTGPKRRPNGRNTLDSARKIYREARLTFERLAAIAVSEFGSGELTVTAHTRLMSDCDLPVRPANVTDLSGFQAIASGPRWFRNRRPGPPQSR